MARPIYVADIEKGLVSPFPDNLPRLTDEYSARGQFMPSMQVVDAINALPTEKGYISYFGQDLSLGAVTEEPYVQDLFVLRLDGRITVLVAMCPGGLYLCCPGNNTPGTLVTTTPVPAITHLVAQKTISLVDGAGFGWTKIVEALATSPSPWMLWSYAVVRNRNYFYQQGLGALLRISSVDARTVLLEWLNPSSIIGTVDAYKWTIEGSIDTASATEHTLTFDFGTELGQLAISHMHKAHVAAAYAATLSSQLRAFLGATSKTLVLP
jgi:hypothetical protein